MTEKRYSHNAIVIVDHLKKDLIYIDGKDALLELAEYVDRLQQENEQLEQSYAQLKHRHSLLHDVCIEAECDRDGYYKDVVSLEKENKKLKAENVQLKSAIKDCIRISESNGALSPMRLKSIFYHFELKGDIG